MAPTQLRRLMLARATRRVTKKGVRLNGRYYNAAELCGHVGEPVEVRFMPHHEDRIEIFIDGEHRCTAVLAERMSQDDVRRLLQRRAEEARWLARQQRVAAKRRRVTYAALTEPGPPVSVTAIEDAAGIAELAGYDDEAMRRLASRSLCDGRPLPAGMVRPRVAPGGTRA